MTDTRPSDVLRATGSLAIVEGILFVVGGILLVVTPFAAVAAFTQVTGVLLVLGGIVGTVRNAGAGHGEQGGGAGILGPILAAIAGVVLLIDPTLAAAFIVTVLGAMLLVGGGMQIAAACGMHGRDHWVAMLVSGILTTLVGAITFLAPGAAIFVFAIFAGVQLVFTGILMIRGGTEFRRVARSA